MMRRSRRVPVGSLFLGGSSPIAVQTMWDRPLIQIDDELLIQLDRLIKTGSALIRFAVPDLETVPLLEELSQKLSVPVVADIHFDYKIALACMDSGIPKIRINPGNIGASWKVEEVVKKALDTKTTIRVGANSGSLPKELSGEKDRASAMVKAVEDQLEHLEKYNFSNTVVSLKSSDLNETEAANRNFAHNHTIPLHLGITEAGPLIPSLVKSTLALGNLLKDGIGDTIRISISDDPLKEVMAGRELLAALGLKRMTTLISCPKCGRTGFDTHAFTREIEDLIYREESTLTLAVMGCMVNGPGEAKHADLGISGYGDSVAIFRHGKIIRREPLEKAKQAFLEEYHKL